MRKEHLILLPLLFGLVIGGGQHHDKKRSNGCDPKYRGHGEDRSPCRDYKCQTQCNGRNSGWYYNGKHKACFAAGKEECGANENMFIDLQDCLKKCNATISVERINPPVYDEGEGW
uniref:Putative der and-72 secreted protein n=1 Tax=Rhipicephalus pulchellus TaxID=72859 RepID=L7LVA9_RHIPC